MSLVVFAVCLVMGIRAENSFETTVERALEAMAVTLGVGLVVGTMAQKMLDENAAASAKNVRVEAAARAGRKER